MDIISWFQLGIVCLLGAISPGPSLALVIGNTLTGGRIYGIATSLGHAIGIGWWAFFTAVGIAEFMVTKSGFLLALQASGAVVLAYIGFRTMSAKEGLTLQLVGPQPISLRMIIKGAGEGLLISLLNPKIALFFLAIFSHLVHPESSWGETGLMGFTAAVIDGAWYVFVALILTGTSLVKVLQARIPAICRISGMVLILIAVYLLAVMAAELS